MMRVMKTAIKVHFSNILGGRTGSQICTDPDFFAKSSQLQISFRHKVSRTFYLWAHSPGGGGGGGGGLPYEKVGDGRRTA